MLVLGRVRALLKVANIPPDDLCGGMCRQAANADHHEHLDIRRDGALNCAFETSASSPNAGLVAHNPATTVGSRKRIRCGRAGRVIE